MNSMNVIRECLQARHDDKDKLYINGSWVPSSGESSLTVENPTNGEIIGSVPDGTIEDADLAVDAARNAFGDWSKSSVEERITSFIPCPINSNRGPMNAELITREVGTPIEYQRLQWLGRLGSSKSYAKLLESYQWEEHVRNSTIVKEPIGVCAFVTPWNFPLHQIIGKVAPAIAAGCNDGAETIQGSTS